LPRGGWRRATCACPAGKTPEPQPGIPNADALPTCIAMMTRASPRMREVASVPLARAMRAARPRVRTSMAFWPMAWCLGV
jgi:hypothetical protein